MSLENYPEFLLNSSECEMTGELKHSYLFKSFRLNIAERQLLRNNSPVPLTPKAFDVLALLVEQNGHLVEKEELLKHVWADSFVEEANIARIIYTLRKTLGEDENGNKFIVTVATKGYRFVAEVTEDREHTQRRSDKLEKPSVIEENFPDTIDVDKPVNASPQTPLVELPIEAKHRARVVLFTVGFLTAVSLILILLFNFPFGSSPAPGSVRSFAVLPLKPINTATTRDEIYEVGIADSLIHKVSSMKGFIVRPLSATRKYADIEQDAIAAGREQQVDYVLSSNYQLADGKIKITAQLFNVANGGIEDTYKSEKDAASVFAIQDAFAGEVGDKLLARFSATESSPVAKRGTTNEEAYRLYLQGMILYDQRKFGKAIENFEHAVTLDPNYALAWTGIAHGHLSARFAVHRVDISEEYQKSKQAFTKALELDPNLSEAHSAMCRSKFGYEYDFAGAERACRRALELNPNSSEAHDTFSSYLVSLGRFDEALDEVKTAIDLDPTSYLNQRGYADFLYYARRYDEAVAQYKLMLELDDDAAPIYRWIIRTFEAQGNESEAFEWFLKSLTFGKQDNETIQQFKATYQISGWQGVVREIESNSDGANYFRRAGLNARLGNKDKAFEFLEKAYRQHSPLMPSLQVEPTFDSLHDDPRFDGLLRRVGLK